MFGGTIENIGTKYFINWDGAKSPGLGLRPTFEVYATGFTTIEMLTEAAVKFFKCPDGDKYDLGVEHEDGILNIARPNERVNRVKGSEKLHFVLIATGGGV